MPDASIFKDVKSGFITAIEFTLDVLDVSKTTHKLPILSLVIVKTSPRKTLEIRLQVSNLYF